MDKGRAYIAGTAKLSSDKKIIGAICRLEDEDCYKLENYDAMPPFLMSIVSDSDHWMFISSSGGLTAGRKNSDHALFPYYTDDKIHESGDSAGSKTIIRLAEKDRILIWDPFSNIYSGLYNTSKNLYKSLIGNSIIFEEVNHDLQLSLRIKWMNSDKFGWIRQTSLKNHSESIRNITMLDGLQNILPHGVLKATQESFSTLMDAYKKSECHLPSKTAIYSMSSIPVDRAEPSEALLATTVWTTESDVNNILLGQTQIDQFHIGNAIHTEHHTKGIRCNYLIETSFSMAPDSSKNYLIIAEVSQDSKEVNNLVNNLTDSKISEQDVLADIRKGSDNLIQMVAKADGIQVCQDKLVAARHFSNVLFNIMRGGIYDQDYKVRTADLKKHLKKFNKALYSLFEEWLNKLPETSTYPVLVEKAAGKNDPDLLRLVLEYLPITFSRRHGDPSRPWNRFSIEVKNEDGSRSLAYEGNWRDIFQNWEALSYSYPAFLPGIIAKFLNASTPDGYNPYRITSNGISWEIFEPSNPWSFIGYWGDHQIIYLLKLLELQENILPGSLEEWLDKELFVYANVPYRIKAYKKIKQNPQDTIDFDEKLNAEIEDEVARKGADGRLLKYNDGDFVHANLTEKILVTSLTKLSNFVPGAGVWMNTQRPEWNDANNALVGNGVSMVTLFYLRRFLSFLKNFLSQTEKEIKISTSVFSFFSAILQIFEKNSAMFSGDISDTKRKEMTDLLGEAGAEYRENVYHNFSRERTEISISAIRRLAELAVSYIDHTIELNRRADGLYNAYNLIDISPDAIKVSYLQAMLEGQVAYLSSGKPSLDETIELLENLRSSALYREDQQSYILYPDKPFMSFLNINNIPDEIAAGSHAIALLLKVNGAGIINRDEKGIVHFCGAFKNSNLLKEALHTLQDNKRIELKTEDIEEILGIYELQFKHHEFTGRSGSFFKYEGLGSIYWHMVSKLLLAVGENLKEFSRKNEDKTKLSVLRKHYNEIRDGIGVHKNPANYGAIPTDPYSHTPSMLGAQQPGMTGQVKEDIISRWNELGLELRNGELHLRPDLISEDEFGEGGVISFTFCEVPFNYSRGSDQGIHIVYKDNTATSKDFFISRQNSMKIFQRSGEILEVNATFNFQAE